LVDESSVTIENIHQHLDMGKPKALAIWDACKEIAFPKLLILLCILAVFAPAFSMSGIPGSLFLPLALAIAFSMITSYFMAQTFVPVIANWFLKDHGKETPAANKKTDGAGGKAGRFENFRTNFLKVLGRMVPYRRPVVLIYFVVITGLVVLFLGTIGRDVLPRVNSLQFQVRFRAPDGTRIERTEAKVVQALGILKQITGKDAISVTSAYIGQHPSVFSISPIYLFTNGPHEAVLQVSLTDQYKGNLDELKEMFRQKMKETMPDVRLSFEPIELTDKILSQGSPTPIEVRIGSRDKKQNEEFAKKVVSKLSQIGYLRDVQIAQSIQYPSLNVTIDRIRAAQVGVDVNDISRSLIPATSSSRYTEKNVWLDEKIGLGYAVQVQVPENQMTSVDDMGQIPVMQNMSRPVLNDVATIDTDTTYGEIDNLGAMPVLSVTANLQNKDLGTATKDVQAAIASLGQLPRGLTIETIGLSLVLTDTLNSLQSGLMVAIVVIFLMLAANFQSFKVSFVVLSTVPAVLLGSLTLLMITGSTLNLQSYMGIIMSVGVSISNAVLLVTNAEHLRLQSGNALEAAKEAVSIRIRPILMTSIAMVAGMIPMATGYGEGGGQVAPLARAVIGGLLASTVAALIILPLVFSWVQGKTSTTSVSLDPEDKESTHYIPSMT